jgi:hypothetical protein
MGGKAFTPLQDSLILREARINDYGRQARVARQIGKSQTGVGRRGKLLLATDKPAIQEPEASTWRIILQDDRRMAVTAANFSAALDMLNPTLRGAIKNVVSTGE